MRWIVCTVAIAALAACEPIGPIAGGELDGKLIAPPSEWTALAEIDTVQLESNPEDPYSVNIWIVAVDGQLYIAAGGGETRWSRHILDNPQVKLRHDDNIYELTAAPVSDLKVLGGVKQAYMDKYRMESDEPRFGSSTVFRLDRRF